MQKTITNIAVLLSISVIGFGQEFAPVKTLKHQQIDGTNIFMVPPDSFEASKNFKGFQNPMDETSMIMVMEIPGPYSEVSKGFDAKMLKASGMELKSKKEIHLSNYNGLLIELDQPANGVLFSKQILVYGDEKSSTLINGVHLKNATQVGEEIRKSLLSIVVDSEAKGNPREALGYTLDEKAGSLQFKAVMGNGMLFNRDLKTPTESIDRATLLADRSFANVAIGDQRSFCVSRLKKYPNAYDLIQSKGIKEIEIDGLKGFELYAVNKDTKNEALYQVVLFDENGGYYLFVGTYATGSPHAISDIKKIIHTFHRKK